MKGKVNMVQPKIIGILQEQQKKEARETSPCFSV